MARIKQINESKDLMYNATMKLLKSKDMEEISMAEIARTAGVSQMTLYRHFPEKEDIILHTATNQLEPIRVTSNVLILVWLLFIFLDSSIQPMETLELHYSF